MADEEIVPDEGDSYENKLVKRLLEKENIWKPYGSRFRVLRICCGCKLLIGPVRSWWWCLEAFSILTAIFFAAECIYHQEFPFGVGLAVSIIFSVYIISSWRVLLCDPGIIQRPPFSQAIENAREVAKKQEQLGFYQPSKDVLIKGQIVRYRYCYICHTFRPPRSAHCGYCDVCVEVWDHHCPVYGGCVAKRNILFFFLMCLSVTAYHGLMLAYVLAMRGLKYSNYLNYLAKYPCSILYIIALPLICILPALLSITPCEKRKNIYGPSNIIQSRDSLPIPTGRYKSIEDEEVSSTVYSDDSETDDSDDDDNKKEKVKKKVQKKRKSKPGANGDNLTESSRSSSDSSLINLDSYI